MATVEGSIEALSRAILGEAGIEIENVRAQALEQAESIRRRARDEADRDRDAILEQAKQEARRLRGQQTATAQLKARTLELEHREQLLQKVFQTVAGRLGEVPQRKDYPRIALTLVREALSQLRTVSAVVRIDKATRDALAGSDLEALARELGIEVVLGEILDNGTGPVAQTVDQRLQFDNTLETRLTRMQGALRAAVYRILIGESE